jgi:hypothetical protein|tara:strand:+ start:307 stop:531 length:225 start_codon:yes stop_codon:yes gene_type:complete
VLLVLRVFGYFGLSISAASIALKLFADDTTAIQYTGGSRNLDTDIAVTAFSIIFLALAAILSELRKVKNEGTQQ